MGSIKNIFLFVVIIIAFLSYPVEAEQQTISGNQFTPSWFNFKRSQQRFILSNPLSDIQIEFQIKQDTVNVNEVSINKNGFWKSIYQTSSHLIEVIAKGQNVFIQIIDQQEQNIKLNFNVLSSLQRIDAYKIVQGNQNPLLLLIEQNCIQENNKVKCEFKNTRQVQIFYHQSKSQQQLSKFKQELKSTNSEQIQQIAQGLSINLDQITNGETIIRTMLTNTLSSLCVENSEYQGYEFYGFCSNTNTKQIERHYSLLTIDILFKYNPYLAAWLTENFLDLLEQKLFYSFSGREWIPIPQHIEVFLTYIKYLKSDSNLSAQKLKKKINKVIEIQNGLINNLLLSEVNHLSEQINYRQKNKVHPSILKMLNQVWKTDLPRAKVSSIYAESFTGDFFYHEKDEKLQTSVGKIIWLIKLINQHIKVIRNYGDSYQKESLQQLLSLSKVMNGYVLDDPKAQNGDFYSIVITENLRVYSKSLGYESLLPFSYGISPAFPINTLLNLTTPIGLASLPLSHHKVRQTYNFRGNINLYFNYKILFGMMQRCSENPKLRVYLNGLNKVVDSLHNLISNSLKQLTDELKPIFYTAWNSQGKGVASEKYLSVLNLSFLKNFETLSNDKDKKPQQNTK